jgi:hypothetical protein
VSWPIIKSTGQVIVLMLALAFSADAQSRKKPFLGCWMRSQEEDTSNGSTGYLHRPCSWNFPPARGRSGFILKSDGKFALIQPSALDSRDTIWGTWRQTKTRRLKIRFPGGKVNWLSYRTIDAGLIRFLYH